MKKILAAFDGSEASMHAVRKAFELGDALGAEVTLAHVVPHVFVPAEVPYDAAGLDEEAVHAGEVLLNRAAADLGRPNIPRVCLKGGAPEALADFAEAGQFDLVVVGSKGRGAVARVLIGSVTDRLVHICKRPLLVVR